MSPASAPLRVTTRNAGFQRWLALTTNRAKRHRLGEFLVQGVRPISMAVRAGAPIRTLIRNADREPSGWARGVLASVRATQVLMSGELIRELGEREDDGPELIAVVGMPADDLSRIPVGPDFLGVVFDRPTMPGNIGALTRSVDAFGGAGLVVTGHAADPYDPRAVRGGTGSLFAVPTVRADSHREVLDWVAGHRCRPRVIGTDENGDVDIADHDLTQPTLIVIGNETTGLSAGWRRSCDHLVRIPMTGTASSLNAASAATVVLYEAARQRRGLG